MHQTTHMSQTNTNKICLTKEGLNKYVSNICLGLKHVLFQKNMSQNKKSDLVEFKCSSDRSHCTLCVSVEWRKIVLHIIYHILHIIP